MSNTNTNSQIAPEQMAAILNAAAQALLTQPPASSTAGTVDAAGAAAATGDPAGAANGGALQAPGADILAAPITLPSAQSAPAPAASSTAGTALAAPANDPEQLALLKKIDTNLTDLSAKIVSIEKTAIRNGAIAGGVAGGISGGIVATGLAFVRSHLGI